MKSAQKTQETESLLKNIFTEKEEKLLAHMRRKMYREKGKQMDALLFRHFWIPPKVVQFCNASFK